MSKEVVPDGKGGLTAKSTLKVTAAVKAEADKRAAAILEKAALLKELLTGAEVVTDAQTPPELPKAIADVVAAALQGDDQTGVAKAAALDAGSRGVSVTKTEATPSQGIVIKDGKIDRDASDPAMLAVIDSQKGEGSDKILAAIESLKASAAEEAKKTAAAIETVRTEAAKSLEIVTKSIKGQSERIALVEKSRGVSNAGTSDDIQPVNKSEDFKWPSDLAPKKRK